MGNGSRTSGGDGDGAGGSGYDVHSAEAETALGLNTEPPCKKMSFMSHHHHHQLFADSTHEIASGSGAGLKSTSGTVGVMATSGKVFFTATQWQELERQTMVYKYIMASIPVPPHLLLPSSTQSNRVGTSLRFSNGLDPEPWRCRRTDGKKWRCSKDVAPDQKYCERHAHKSRNRSRKPVEIKPHNTKHDYIPIPPSADINNTNTKSNPTMLASSNQQSSDWFMKSGTTPASQSSIQFQQPMVKRDQMFKLDFKGNHQHKSYLDYSTHCLNMTNASDAATGWSRIGNVDNCSLTLSMQSGGNAIELEDQESFQMAVGMLGGDRSQHQWLNHGSWAGSTPGGPLGEALCLGIASGTNAVSPHGRSSSTTTSSSCDGGGGGGGHGLGFIWGEPGFGL